MRICLVTNEILGAHKNGGIGTATSHLALLLGRHGHRVTLFYVGLGPLDPANAWAELYRRAEVEVIHFARVPKIEPNWMAAPVAIYEQLGARNDDVVIFQEWMALGHACVVAKRAGLAFGGTVLATIAHSSSPWILEANKRFPASQEDLARAHMERQAIELSDALVSPSAYLVQWMCSAGWTLPKSTRVIPYFLNGSVVIEKAAPVRMALPTILKPDHIAFFGRLEERKGIGIFLSAITSCELMPFRFRLTFLGQPATRTVEEIRNIVASVRPDLLDLMDFHTDLSSDEAKAWLVANGPVVVIPSLTDNSPCVVYEALALGVPFIASGAGGIPELVRLGDRQRCLFAPNARDLALKLRDVLSSESWDAAYPAFDQDEVATAWLDWLVSLRGRIQPSASASRTRRPDTTVIVTHYERPRLVKQALDALVVQSDRNFEVLLVDDGSQSDDAVAFLNRLTNGYCGLKLRVLRQQNRYVGAARNAGLRQAETSHVIFLDDDNVPFPNMVEVFRDAACASGAAAITCQMQVFTEPMAEPNLQVLFTGERWAFPGGPVALGAIRNVFGDATAIYRRDVLLSVGGFHEMHGVTHEDWQMHLRVILAGHHLLSLPVPLFWYRVVPDSMIHSTSIYDNMRVVVSALEERVPVDLRPLINIAVGITVR